MNVKQALKRRGELEDERERLRAARHAVADERATINVAVLRKDLAAAQVQEARDVNGAAEHVGELRAQIDDAERRLARLAERGEALAGARAAAERDLEQLYADERDAFVEHAETLTVAAAGRTDALEALYREVWDAQRAARMEWQQLLRRGLIHERSGGLPDALPAPANLFPVAAQRPGATPPALATNVEVGDIRIWQHEDGHTQSARVGEPMDRHLHETDDWQVIDVRRKAKVD